MTIDLPSMRRVMAGPPRFWRRAAMVCGGVLAVLIGALAAAIALGTEEPPRPGKARVIDRADMPPLSRYVARDGTALAYRAYAGGDDRVAVLIHGSATESSVMNALAKTLREAGATVYALDLRGHGASGRRGDIDYIGQWDDDLADFLGTIRPKHPGAAFTLIGFSLGGAFALRVAGGSQGGLFDSYILLAPALRYPAPLARPDAGGWSVLHLPRVVGLVILNRLGIHWFEGLETIVWAIPPGNSDLTGAYSFRLMMNAGDVDYVAALKYTRQPTALLAGADDDQFFAERYGPLLKPAKPDLLVELLPGLGHVDMITQPAALTAIRLTFERMSTR